MSSSSSLSSSSSSSKRKHDASFPTFTSSAHMSRRVAKDLSSNDSRGSDLGTEEEDKVHVDTWRNAYLKIMSDDELDKATKSLLILDIVQELIDGALGDTWRLVTKTELESLAQPLWIATNRNIERVSCSLFLIGRDDGRGVDEKNVAIDESHTSVSRRHAVILILAPKEPRKSKKKSKKKSKRAAKNTAITADQLKILAIDFWSLCGTMDTDTGLESSAEQGRKVLFLAPPTTDKAQLRLGSDPDCLVQFSAGEKPKSCVVCMQAPRTHERFSCGHKCVCKPCATQLTKCPLCRQDLEHLKQSFKQEESSSSNSIFSHATFIPPQKRSLHLF